MHKEYFTWFVFCGLFFCPSDPTSDAIPAFYPFLWVGQSADTIEACWDAAIRHTKRWDRGARTNGEQSWQQKTEKYGRTAFIRDQIQ